MKLLAESFALRGLGPRFQTTATEFDAQKSASAREQSRARACFSSWAAWLSRWNGSALGALASISARARRFESRQEKGLDEHKHSQEKQNETGQKAGLIGIVLWTSALQALAIEGLNIAVQGSNIVLAWPSVPEETFIVQYRPTLNTNTPWVTLTNSLPAAIGTNWTTFVHSNSVQYPEGMSAAAGNGGGAPPGPASSQSTAMRSAMTAEQRAAFREESARRTKAAIAELTAKLRAAVAKTEADHQKWIAQGKPLRRAIAVVGETAQSASSQTTTNTGFYRVVRAGIYFAGITNGTVLSGQVTLPVEVGLTGGQSLDSLYATSGTNSSLSEGVQGLEFVGLESGQPQAAWDTTQVPNGMLQVNLGAVVDGSVDVAGSSISVLVSNEVWFPDPYNWAGYFIEVQAQSVHSNGTYHVDIYDDTGFKIIDVDGPTDAEGYITYGGVRGFLVQNYDDETFEQYPSQYYKVVVATSPSGGGFVATAVAINTNFVWVERPWPATTYQNLYTQFAIGYQPIYGNPAGGGISAVTLQTMIQTVYTAAEGRAANLPVTQGSSQSPFELWTQLEFTRLLLDLRFDEVRNLYYFGHGNPKFIGQKSLGRFLDISDFYLALNTRGDPLKPWTLTNAHPFRFVFLDGCSTADGNLCKAFGIPKIKNMPPAQFWKKGLRYRAFLGWNGKQTIGWAGALNTSHTEFVGEFFNKWALPDDLGNLRTVRQAKDATPVWNQKKYLIIYGYEGLLFDDTLP